jgi:hypothetical protein
MEHLPFFFLTSGLLSLSLSLPLPLPLVSLLLLLMSVSVLMPLLSPASS